jgi:hypothetical protein
VPLVYSTTTGLVSPQYHVVFDDKFTTVKCLHTNQLPSNWPILFNTSSTFYVDEDFTKTNFYHQDSFQDFTQPSSNPSSLHFQGESPNITPAHDQSPPSSHHLFQSNPEHSTPSEREISTISATSDADSTTIPSNTLTPPNTHTGWNQSHRYNTRFKKQHIAAIAPFNHHHDFNDNTINAYLSSNDLFSTNDNNLSDAIHHHVFTASHKDTLHFGELHHDPDREHFQLDMQREMTDLLSTKTIELTHRSLVPSENKPLNSFRRKRAPDWTIIKHCSRLCPDGGKQIEGINFWATYAPVVSWRTVRLTLILSLLSGLRSRQVDYVSAYTQAPLDCELYMNIPPGFIVQNGNLVFTHASTRGNSSDFVLRINKNMYGLKQAGNNWFDTLKESLITRGFKQSSIDPCLFIRSNCIIVVYVDDCLLFAKSDAVLDSIIASLQSKFNLTTEGDVGAFLGVDIHRNADGFLELL